MVEFRFFIIIHTTKERISVKSVEKLFDLCYTILIKITG